MGKINEELFQIWTSGSDVVKRKKIKNNKIHDCFQSLLLMSLFLSPNRQGSGDIAISLASIPRQKLVRSITLIPFEIF